MYLYELTVVDPVSKQYESKIIASHRFKNLSIPQLENTFGKMISSGGNEFTVTKRIKIEAFIFVKSNVSQAGLGDKKYLGTAQCVSMAMQLIKSFGNPEFTD